MKTARMAVAALLLSVLVAGVTWAQAPVSSGQPSLVRTSGYPQAGAPGERPVAYIADEPAANGNGGNGEEEKEEEPKPWKLFNGSWLADRNINVHGWVDMGITANSDNPASHY